MGLVGYMVDAALNFPGERSEMQLLLEFLIAFIIVVYVISKSEIIVADKTRPINFSWYATVYIILMLLFSIPSIGINYLTFQSMKGQLYIMDEIDKTKLMPLAKIQGFFANANTQIPNLTSSGDLAIDAVIARYYIKEKKYDSAIILLNRSKMANPYLYYNEFLKGLIYIQTNQLDSANKYCKLSFYNRPRDQSYFINMMVTAYKQKDTVELNKAFNFYIKYRDEPYPYKIYLNAMVDLTSNNDQGLIKIADTAIKKFSSDTVNLKDIVRYRNTLLNRNNSGTAKVNTGIDEAKNEQLAAQMEGLAIAAYNKKDYINAATLFIKASKLDPDNYTFYENVGLSFFNTKEYKKAIPYFDMAINSNKAVNGKSELFKGLALIVLGNKSGGCEWLHKAKEKNYPEADIYIKNNCN
jgi:tetratricopeptide (TPR) repeat protein